jgi:hypothetical protein
MGGLDPSTVDSSLRRTYTSAFPTRISPMSMIYRIFAIPTR